MDKELDPHLKLAILQLAEKLFPDAIRLPEDPQSVGPQVPVALEANPAAAGNKPAPARVSKAVPSIQSRSNERSLPRAVGRWPQAGSVSIVRGYTVRTTTKTVSPEEAERRRAVVAAVIARSIRSNTD